jgi:N-acetylneuraminate synthase
MTTHAGNRVYIIAEAGVNHNGSPERALQMVDVAARAGADAVKFQTFRTQQLAVASAPKAAYQLENTGGAQSQYDMLSTLELDLATHRELLQRCRLRGVQFLSTPFDLESVDLLAKALDLPLLKLPSGEITNGPLLLKAAQSGKPVILSTGMSTLAEVEEALGVLAFGYTQAAEPPSLPAFREAYRSRAGKLALQEKVTLLQCTTEYPAPFADVNLRAMDTMREAFGLPVGLSDHTAGYAVSIAAAARGACVIEKHFTLSRELPGPDHKASLEPDELAALVTSIRQVESALGSARKAPAPSEGGNRQVARKSLVAARSLSAGERLTPDDLAAKRPGDGVSPMHYWEWLGQEAPRSYAADEQLTR